DILLQSGYGVRYIHAAVEQEGANEIDIQNSIIYSNRDNRPNTVYKDISFRDAKSQPDVYIYNTCLQDAVLPENRFIRLISIYTENPLFDYYFISHKYFDKGIE
ncbi:MAG: hypothetical protein JW800_00580, partial [Candidatus Omnitrophica bacterium]|nr:hypothetical protein [Candidatus Omnitrophota bacterium]